MDENKRGEKGAGGPATGQARNEDEHPVTADRPEQTPTENVSGE